MAKRLWRLNSKEGLLYDNTGRGSCESEERLIRCCEAGPLLNHSLSVSIDVVIIQSPSTRQNPRPPSASFDHHQLAAKRAKGKISHAINQSHLLPYLDYAKGNSSTNDITRTTHLQNSQHADSQKRNIAPQSFSSYYCPKIGSRPRSEQGLPSECHWCVGTLEALVKTAPKAIADAPSLCIHCYILSLVLSSLSSC